MTFYIDYIFSMYIIINIAREMNENLMIYHRLVKKWLRTVEIDRAEHQQCMGCFKQELAKKTDMQVDYDSDMGLVLAMLIREVYRDNDGNHLSPRSSQMISTLLKIVRTLYQHLFIGQSDVKEILENISIKQAQIWQFLESEVMPVETRWNSCVPYQIELFRFIAPFKGISRSFQRAIQDSFKHKPYHPIKLKDSEYPSWLRSQNALQQRLREHSEDKQKTKQSINQPQSSLQLSSMMNLDISVISNHQQDCSELFLDLNQ